MYNGAHSSALELLLSTDCLLKKLSEPRISKESPHKGLIILTIGGHHSGTKLAKEETGSNPHSSAAATGVPQASRIWSGLQQSYSRGARLLEGKLRNRNTSSSTIWTSTQRPYPKSPSKIKIDKSMKMGRNQAKKDETLKDQNTFPPPRDHSSSPSRKQNRMEKKI